MKTALKILPWLLLALFLAEIIAVVAPKKDGEYHVREFGRLPVLQNGRVQPFDSVAQNALLQIRNTGDVPLQEIPSWQFWHHPEKLKATPWLLEVISRPDDADERPIFLIHHPDLLGELKIWDKGVAKSALRYYTFNQLKPVLAVIKEQARNAGAVESQLRNTSQRQVLNLYNAVSVYQRLKNLFRLPGIEEGLNRTLDDLQASIGPGVEALSAQRDGKPFKQADADHLWNYVKLSETLTNDHTAGQFYPMVMPPPDPETLPDNWGNLGLGMIESLQSRAIYPPFRWLATAVDAYHDRNPGAFNGAVDDYKSWLELKLPAEAKKGRSEFFFNQSNFFKHALIIDGMAFVFGVAALLAFGISPRWFESLRRSSLWLILLALTVHTFALIFRMVLEGRPPVTNLYSSAIFIGWGAMILGVALEFIYRVGIGNIVASFAGLITLIIANNLATGGDTMEMMRAVLDNNFWLATHVVIVTLGYASTFVAGLLAITYIFLGVFTPMLQRKLTRQSMTAPSPVAGSKTAKTVAKEAGPIDVGKAFSKMVYAILCFATLFSFVGTVLGGIWADQSWGRFWGWDVKENGALIIVLWNATVLHARWGGLVKERGLMNMAVVGNIVTSFSWFGVNLLSVGLHSYGFMESGALWLYLFVIANLMVIALGLLPKHYWRSFRGPPPVAAPPGANKPAPAIG
jgi:cytochrome c-type biogenesis protein CcsB